MLIARVFLAAAALTLSGALAASACASAQAAGVTAYALPAGTTVLSDSLPQRIVIDARGDIAAIATSTDGESKGVVRWRLDGSRSIALQAREGDRTPPYLRAVPSSLVFRDNGELLISTVRIQDGGTMSFLNDIVHWPLRSPPAPLRLPSCLDWEPADTIVAAQAAQGLVLWETFRNEIGVNAVPENPAYAPQAALLRRNGVCQPLGDGYVTAAAGDWIGGWRAYQGANVIAPVQNIDDVDMRGVVWHGTIAHELPGRGVVLAINHRGDAAGATSPQQSSFLGHGPVRPGRAIVTWIGGRRREVKPGTAADSIALAIADDGTAAAYVRGPGRAEHAFRLRPGHDLERLDDLPHPRGWQFGSVLAIAPDGALIGIGTYRGVPTVFAWRE